VPSLAGPDRQPQSGPGPVRRAVGRAINNAVVRVPALWPLLRRPVTRFFDSIATGWDERIQPERPERRAPLEAALEGVGRPPGRVLEIGTGTGAGAFILADRFPEAEILGIDISPKMIERARAKLAERSVPRVRFAVADAAQLPEGETYDLIAMLNMPPFFDQVAKLLAPGGHVVHVSSLGARTPFYTPTATLQKQFARRGVRPVKAGVAGEGTFYLGERGE
jgi:SAM-dependent methyltransferase